MMRLAFYNRFSPQKSTKEEKASADFADLQIPLNYLRVEQALEDGFCEVAGSHNMKIARARARRMTGFYVYTWYGEWVRFCLTWQGQYSMVFGVRVMILGIFSQEGSMLVTINGKQYEAEAGQTILQVARKHGVYIPSLCYHEKVGVAGKCRVCVVEVEGMRGLQTSCSVVVREGMNISTNTEKAVQAQKLVVDLLLSSGQHDCLSCAQNGKCELQDAAYFLGIERPTLVFSDLEPHCDESSEFVKVDHNKCISCGRCVAACQKTVTNDVLDFGFRGANTEIVFDDGKKMGDSTCVQCGECVQICPVGALTEKKVRGKARYWETEKIRSVCPYCGVGCTMEIHVDRKLNQVVRVNGDEKSPVNEGMLCVKGRFGYDFVDHADRLTSPLIRNDDGSFRKASWDEALDLVATKLNDIKAKHGADKIMGLASAKVTNEENYTFQKFMRTVIGTNNVDHCARL